MKRTIAIGVILFLAFAIAFAPASLLRTLLPAQSGIDLLQAGGTLWNGHASLYLAAEPAGQVAWTFDPATLLSGSLGYDISLTGPEHDLRGTVSAGLGSAAATLSGQVSAAFANRWLAPYDIAISGDLTLEEVHVQAPYDVAVTGEGSAAGTIRWAGGPVSYRLSGRSHQGDLPPLAAYLGEKLVVTVYPAEGRTPLITGRVLADGFVKIGVTQLLTGLVGNPWPGSHADHEVVLEVEEQFF